MEKPLDAFAPFKRTGERSDGVVGRRYRCRECESKRWKDRAYAQGKIVPRIHGSRVRDLAKRIKQCSLCKEWLPFKEFSSRAGERDHDLRAWCKKCAAKKAIEYTIAGGEKLLAHRRVLK